MTYLLALLSLERLVRAIDPRDWRLIRAIALNYIAFIFFLDFARLQKSETVLHLAEYVPFAVLAVAGPALRLLAWIKPILFEQRTAPSH